MPNPSSLPILPPITSLYPVPTEESKIDSQDRREHRFSELARNDEVDHPAEVDGIICYPKTQIDSVLGGAVTTRGNILAREDDVTMADYGTMESTAGTIFAVNKAAADTAAYKVNRNINSGNYRGPENTVTYRPFSLPVALSIDTQSAPAEARGGEYDEMQGPQESFSPSVAQSADILLQYVTEFSSDRLADLPTPAATTNITPLETANITAAPEPELVTVFESSPRGEASSGTTEEHATTSYGRAAVLEFTENLTMLSGYIDLAVKKVPPELLRRLDSEVPCDWSVDAMTGYIEGFISASLVEK